jgi:hypothetical protein
MGMQSKIAHCIVRQGLQTPTPLEKNLLQAFGVHAGSWFSRDFRSVRSNIVLSNPCPCTPLQQCNPNNRRGLIETRWHTRFATLAISDRARRSEQCMHVKASSVGTKSSSLVHDPAAKTRYQWTCVVLALRSSQAYLSYSFFEPPSVPLRIYLRALRISQQTRHTTNG